MCKEFFLTTLDTSQRRISYLYDHFQTCTNTPTKRKQGTRQKRIAESVLDGTREHTRGIPCVDSHYCRANISRKYFESELSISRLYELYLDFCKNKNYQTAKKHLYTKIFLTEFNISFLHPRKDRCDKCEECKRKERVKMVLESDHELHLAHVNLNEDARQERKNHRESGGFSSLL